VTALSRSKLSLLQLADELGNFTRACKREGCSVQSSKQ